MKHLVVSLAVALVGCGPAAAPTPIGPAPPAAAPAPAATTGPAARQVELTAAGAGDQPREVRVLVDEPSLKLVTIVLRHGTALPAHRADVPVTIQALEGAGTVVAGGERLAIDRAHAVVLAAGIEHAVEPDPGTDLVLLVHHLGRGHEHRP